MSDSNRELLTAAEVAHRLNVKKSWVYNSIASKRLPFPVIRCGHYVRFQRADIENFIARQVDQPAQPASRLRRFR